MSRGVSAESRLAVTAGLLAGVFVLVHSATWLLGGLFEPLRAAASDRLFDLRAAISALRPQYDPRIVQIVIDDESTERVEDFYIGREEYARLVDNLGRAGVSIQFHDVIFAAPQSEAGDAALEAATRGAGNVYYGMGVGLSSAPTGAILHEEPAVERQRWSLTRDDDALDLPPTTRYFPTFRRLADAARGLAFLDILPDRDGVYRRSFLLAQDADGFLPSVGLLVACDFLGVTPDRVRIGPGRTIRLLGARLPGSTVPQDIVVPVDRRGRLRVNYLGEWGAMKTYPFATVFEASDDRFTMEDLREELEGTIAIVTSVATGAEDIGAVPTDPLFPRAAIHATVINGILTDAFLRELTGWQMLLWIELPLLVLLLFAALRLSTIPFVSLALGAGLVYILLTAAAFLWAQRILDLPGPLMLLVGSTVVVASYQYHVEAQSRARIGRELAMARDIQIRTFPKQMPALRGYDIAGHSDPADETGGDTYDVVPLDQDRLMLLLGDATGHGIGPALSVTQVRAMLRMATRLGADLDAAMIQINDQLAEDLASNRFVTAFLGVLSAAEHRVTYHAAGQGPLMHFHAATGEFDWYSSTTRPMGLIETLVPPTAERIDLAPGDILGLMTDGLYEYENTAGEQYGEERVAELVRRLHDAPTQELLNALFDDVRRFGRGVPQADDITMLLVRRLSRTD